MVNQLFFVGEVFFVDRFGIDILCVIVRRIVVNVGDGGRVGNRGRSF